MLKVDVLMHIDPWAPEFLMYDAQIIDIHTFLHFLFYYLFKYIHSGLQKKVVNICWTPLILLLKKIAK